jgi:putative aldouronate transport system permease protein
MIRLFTSQHGLFNQIIELFGGDPVSGGFMIWPQFFRTIFIGSGIWQGLGWGSIIYIAAIAGVSQELYEAATIDGAKRFRRMWHITLPGIQPTIVILLILSFGGMMSLGAEKVLLLYEPSTYVVGDVISTYVYREGLLGNRPFAMSFGAAIGVMNSLVNMVLLIAANYISRKVTETSLW